MDVVNFSSTVYSRLRDREQALSEALSHGAPKDWSEYQKMVGELQGILFAIDTVNALLKDYDDDD